MGPRLNGRGAPSNMLVHRTAKNCFNGAAAEWPRSEKGKLSKLARKAAASMGPRLNGRGAEEFMRLKTSEFFQLQWGRG